MAFREEKIIRVKKKGVERNGGPRRREKPTTKKPAMRKR